MKNDRVETIWILLKAAKELARSSADDRILGDLLTKLIEASGMAEQLHDSFRMKGQYRVPRRIPETVAKRLAEQYGYHQVVILARKPSVGESRITAWGEGIKHHKAAEDIGDVLTDLGEGKFVPLRKIEIISRLDELAGHIHNLNNPDGTAMLINTGQLIEGIAALIDDIDPDWREQHSTPQIENDDESEEDRSESV